MSFFALKRVSLFHAALAGALLFCLPGGAAQAEEKEVSELEAARAALAEFRRSAGAQDALPPAQAELGGWLEEAVTAAEKREALRKEIAAAEQAAASARDRLASWSGFGTEPPYPVGLLDAAREEAAAARQRLESSAAQAAQIEAALARHRRDLDEASATARRLAEAAARESEPAARAARELEAAAAAARARALGIQAGLLRDQAALERLEAARLRAERDLAEKKLRAIGSAVRLSDKDLDAALARLRAAAEELDKRRNALERAALRASGETARLTATELKLVDLQSELAAIESGIWSRRAAFLSAPKEARRESLAFLQQTAGRLAALSREFEEGAGAAFASANAARARLRAAPAAAERAALEAEAERAEKEAGLYVEALRVLRSAQKAAEWFGADLGGGLTAASLAADVSASVWDGLRRIWQTELYPVEDTVTVDGKRVTGYRGITVGKVVFVLAVFACGWLLLRWAVRKLERVIAKRLSLAPEQSAVARRWFFSLGIFVLALSALHTAGIPLTAFAFLGGALAIGVGFATQNLIRNFISGLIILFERPFKVNDILDAGGVNGRVATIGLRASVIRHWDGIETLIPNSALLEGNVTNWTHSDQLVRDTIRAGVVYGSDARRVSDVLLECARGHGLVLREPEPKVYFEDFGESAMVFRLDYWVDFRKASRPDVASDLRFMIAKALAAAGIEMAFPHRDVRLSAEKPLAVRIEPPAAAEGGQALRPMP